MSTPGGGGYYSSLKPKVPTEKFQSWGGTGGAGGIIPDVQWGIVHDFEPKIWKPKLATASQSLTNYVYGD